MSRTTFVFAAIASLAACVPTLRFVDETEAAAPVRDAQAEAEPEAADASDAGADVTTAPNDAGADTARADANDASDGDGGLAAVAVLLSAQTNATGAVDAAAPWETHSVSVTRRAATSKLVLASTADGIGGLYVDDNIHVLVAPTIGTAADQYYEFWSGYPCPAASTTMPPGSPGGGNSPPIDVSFLFSADTTSPQQLTLEFWHCVSHAPAHGVFYLVEK